MKMRKTTIQCKPSRSTPGSAFPGLYLLVAVAALAVAVGGRAAVQPAAAQNQDAWKKRKPSPNDCLFDTTIFTEDGFRVPNADVIAHPFGKKKPVWEDWTGQMGEVVLRVPPYGDYEIQVKAQGYTTQTQRITAQFGDKVDVIFHMPRKVGKKS
jgi:hypothetical protein